MTEWARAEDGICIPLAKLDEGAVLPSYARLGDAGADLVAREEVELAPGGGRAVVGTGIAIALPAGCVGLVVPRSGLAMRHGVTCLNTPGIIDSGYRGELKVLLVNTDPVSAYRVAVGDRIAQLVVLPYATATFVQVAELGESERGHGGFGHSGR